MATPASWNVTYTDAEGHRQRATGLADWDAARAEAARLRSTGARWVKTHPQFATLQDTIAHANRNNVPPAPLFIDELDGMTFRSRREVSEYWDWKSEHDAEMAIERALETNDQYAWEDEQDRLRAAAFGDAFDAWQDRVWGAV